ncbi:MAG: XRE family transcriptional regulator [Gammaproteobacteria bacterium]|nr:MAG: XRE family transcriptional regulator [Gammaproteobacteria bacterium]
MSKLAPITQNSLPLGEWLRHLRTELNLPLRVVAEAVGMDLTHLHKIELGQRLPTEDQARKLACYFKMEEKDLLARRIVEKFRQEFADGPETTEAILLLAEEAGIYTSGYRPKRAAR